MILCVLAFSDLSFIIKLRAIGDAGLALRKIDFNRLFQNPQEFYNFCGFLQLFLWIKFA